MTRRGTTVLAKKLQVSYELKVLDMIHEPKRLTVLDMIDHEPKRLTDYTL